MGQGGRLPILGALVNAYKIYRYGRLLTRKSKRQEHTLLAKSSLKLTL